MNKGIAVAGNLIVDFIKYIESYPAPQMLTTITDVSRTTGGLCCNCVLTLAKLDPGLPVKAIGLVGGDDAGGYILSRFAEHPSVDVSRILKRGATSYTDVMTVQSTVARTFFHYRGSNALLAPEHFDFGALDADILHIGYILLLDSLDAPDSDYPTAMCRVLDAAQKAGIRTSIDVVSEEGERFTKLVPPALQYVDYCIINEIEASRTTGIALRGAGACGAVGAADTSANGMADTGAGAGAGGKADANVIGATDTGAGAAAADTPLAENLQAACRALMDMGVGRWVVIHMPELSCGLERGGAFVREPSWKIPDGFKKSSVGAGDAFASGILYGAYNGWTLAKSIHIAGAVAAYSLSGMGASDAIKPLPELLNEMNIFQ